MWFVVQASLAGCAIKSTSELILMILLHYSCWGAACGPNFTDSFSLFGFGLSLSKHSGVSHAVWAQRGKASRTSVSLARRSLERKNSCSNAG